MIEGGGGEDGADPGDAQPARANRRREIVAAIAVLTVLTGLFAWGATSYSNVNGQLKDIQAIRRVAGDFGAATLTYDYRDLKPFERNMNEHATGVFKRDLGQRMSALKTSISEFKSRSEATVKQIYVSDIENHSATAWVVIEAKAQNGDGPLRTLDENYLELQLVKAGKRWLIDGVSSLDLGQGAARPSAPAATTTTTSSK